MKKIYIILSLMTLLILASCSSSKSDMHSMDNGNEMQGATHEESQEVKEKTMSPVIEQKNETPTEIDEESIVGDGNMHSMDDGTNMEGSTHEESQDHIEGDTHGMDDGSEMQGHSHSEGM